MSGRRTDFAVAGRSRRAVRLALVCLVSVALLAAGVGGADGTSPDPLRERTTVSYDASTETFRFAFEYDVPDAITELTVRFPALDRPSVAVESTANLERTDQTQFEWDGGADPRVVVTREGGGSELAEGYAGYADGETALAPTVRTILPFRYTSDEPPDRDRTITFDGNGHAGKGIVYAGPHDLRTRGVDGTDVELVVPDGVEENVDEAGMLDQFETAERHLEASRPFDRSTAFVVPGDRIGDAANGRAFWHSVYVDERTAAVDGVRNVPSHEYAHLLYGVYGTGEMYWLTEAAAEYYGYLIAYNSGSGDFEAFLETARTDEYRDAVLTNADAMRSSQADYQKGAHVLAGLDARIQEATAGDRTLADVLVTDEHDLTTYDGFEDAVVAVSGDESLRDWLDRYVRSDSLPAIQEQRQYYAFGEVTTSTPTATPTSTAAPTPTATPTSTATPTASATPTPTATSTPTATATPPATPTPTATATHTPSPTESPGGTATDTETPVVDGTPVPPPETGTAVPAETETNGSGSGFGLGAALAGLALAAAVLAGRRRL